MSLLTAKLNICMATEQFPQCMADAAAKDSRCQPIPLARLPYPVGWRLVCDFLGTHDIIHLAQTTSEHLNMGFSMVQHLTLRIREEDENLGRKGEGCQSMCPSRAVGSHLARFLSRCVELESLSCRSLMFSKGECLGGAMRQLRIRCLHSPSPLSRVRVLALSHAGLRVEGLLHLLPSLHLFPALEELLLDGNALGNQGVRAFSRSLRGLGWKDSEGGRVSERFSSMGTGQCLKALSLASNGIGAAGANELALLLSGAGNGDVRAWNGGDAHPAPALLETSQHQSLSQRHPCALLEALCLDGNVLGPSGTAHLARAFRRGACTQLRQLHLRNNDVRGQGLQELLSAFASGACPHLTVLSLESNMFGTVGARWLAHALSSGACADLRVLNLNFTFIGEHGMRALAEAFGQGACRRIHTLYLKSACLRRASTLDHLQASTRAGEREGRGEKERGYPVLVL